MSQQVEAAPPCPLPEASRPLPGPTSPLPDYLPARMLNEFVYCPRLFYYEWVEGLFADNRETVEGTLRHQKLEKKQDALPRAEDLADDDTIHSRSVALSSETFRLIARMDLIEGAGGEVVPVDYKRGAPRKANGDGVLEAWDTDRVQLAAQAMVLRDNGYRCNEGVIYYVQTKQRVRVPIDDALIKQVQDATELAWTTAKLDRAPSPLDGSSKCPRCSLVGICLPDETEAIVRLLPHSHQGMAELSGTVSPIRRLVPARDDLRPLYLNQQGLSVSKSGHVLKICDKGKVTQEVRTGEISQLNVLGNIQLSTQTIQTLCMDGVPVCYFTQSGWFYGITQGFGLKNIFLRREQFRQADDRDFCLKIARAIVAAKIRNQRTLLQRNHIEPPATALAQMKCAIDDAQHAESAETLLGIEGNAARVYFQNFSGMIKVGREGNWEAGSGHEATGNGKENEPIASGLSPVASSVASDNSPTPLTFDFEGRNRRPPRDPVNALLSLAYSVLAKDLTVICQAVGFDPYLGFFHRPRFGRPALALDLMEPFRPLIADSAVLTAINTRMVTPTHFIQTGPAVVLTPEARKPFFRAYEQRMNALVTHPLFGYRVNYRRILEIQTRLLSRVVTGEIATYPPFTTR